MKRAFGQTASALILGLTASMTATPVQAETLWEALAAAYQSNPQLEAQRAALRATDESVSQATALFRPSVVAQGTVQKTDTDTSYRLLPDPTKDTNTTTKVVTATASQNLFNGFSDYNTRKAAVSNVKAGRAVLSNTEQSILFATASVYMDVVRDEATLKLNDNNVQVLNRQLEASKDRFRVGEITRTDVAQSEARLSRAISTRSAAEANLAASRANYESIIGNAPGTLESSPALPDLPASMADAFATARENNPQIAAAREAERAAHYNVGAAKGSLLPDVSATAGYRYQGNNFMNGANAADYMKQNTWSAAVSVTVPLYQSGAEYSRIRQAKELESQRKLDIAFAEREVTEAVRSSWERYRATKAQIAATQAQVNAAEIALDGVRQEAAVGSRTTLDVLDAEQELLDARVSLVRAQRDQYVAAFSLLASTGRLTAEGLAMQVERYNPVQHYDRVSNSIIGTRAGN